MSAFRPLLAGRSSFRLSANRMPASMNRQRYVNNLKTNNLKSNNLKSNDLKSNEVSKEKLGGRLAGFLGSWERLTQDPWILNVIEEGVK